MTTRTQSNAYRASSYSASFYSVSPSLESPSPRLSRRRVVRTPPPPSPPTPTSRLSAITTSDSNPVRRQSHRESAARLWALFKNPISQPTVSDLIRFESNRSTFDFRRNFPPRRDSTRLDRPLSVRPLSVRPLRVGRRLPPSGHRTTLDG